MPTALVVDTILGTATTTRTITNTTPMFQLFHIIRGGPTPITSHQTVTRTLTNVTIQNPQATTNRHCTN